MQKKICRITRFFLLFCGGFMANLLVITCSLSGARGSRAEETVRLYMPFCQRNVFR